jgi:HAMP domain-containing protein
MLVDRGRAKRARILTLLGIVAASSLVLLLVGLWYARRYTMQPILQLAAAARRIRDGERSARMPVVRRDELTSLAQAFNEMADHNQSLMDSLDLRRKYAELLTENMPVGTVLLDESLVIVRTSPSLQRMLQMTGAEVCSRPLTEVLPVEGLTERLQVVMETGEPVCGLALKLALRDGTKSPLRISAAATCLGEEETDASAHIVLVVEDLTVEQHFGAEATAAQGRLAAQIEKFQAILAVSPVTLYTCEPSEPYGATFVTENVETKFGFPPGYFLNDPKFWASRIHPEDAPDIFEGLCKLFEHGHPAHEYRWQAAGSRQESGRGDAGPRYKAHRSCRARGHADALAQTFPGVGAERVAAGGQHRSAPGR